MKFHSVNRNRLGSGPGQTLRLNDDWWAVTIYGSVPEAGCHVPIRVYSHIDDRPVRPYHQVVKSENGQRPRAGAVATLGSLIQATRPLQWIKNLLVFLPLFFSVEEAWTLDDPDRALTLVARTAGAFVLFCFLSGSVYLWNDAADVRQDRAHPTKRFRPIASGAVSIRLALSISAVMALGALAASFTVLWPIGPAALAYILVQAAYSAGLKRVPLLDVAIVASGFVLRVLAGAIVIEVPISPWLYLCSGLGALFLALSKRRSELARGGESANEQRDTLRAYTAGMLDQMIGVVATSALVSYALYTFTAANLPDNHAMMLTIPFVVFGLFRYIYLVHTRDAGESPERILIADVPLIMCVVLWLATGWAVLLLAG